MTACTPFRDTLENIQSRQQLAEYRYDLASGFYQTVIEQSQKVLQKNGETRPPADVALYALGEVYADHAYQGKDYAKSKVYFEKLIRNFPYSPLTSEARTYVALYDAMAAKDRTIARLEKLTARVSNPALSEGEEIPAARPLVENHNFAEAIARNLKILQEAGDKPPADEALYNLGLIYAHNDNPGKDYGKSREYFARLAKDFPNSPLAEEASIWVGLFGVFEKMRQVDLEIEQQKKQLNQ